MKLHVRAALILLLAAGTAGTIANMAGPHRLGWIGEWAFFIEAQAHRERIPLIHVADLRRGLAEDDIILLDARSLDEYDAGHIPGAMPFPLRDAAAFFPHYAALLNAEQTLVAYCSAMACDEALHLLLMLRARGAESVALFAGGWEEWRRAQAALNGEGR